MAIIELRSLVVAGERVAAGLVETPVAIIELRSLVVAGERIATELAER